MQPSGFHFEDGPVGNGLQLYWACHALALQARKGFREYALLPSGARLFYYTRRLLLAEGLPEVHPDEASLGTSVVERFLQAAPLVTEHVVVEFARAVRLRAQPGLALKSLLETPFMGVSARIWLPDHLVHSRREIPRRWEQLWETCWREAEQEHLARLWVWIRPDRLPVVPVAAAQASPQVALRLLQTQVAQDWERGESLPAAGAYLYHEPLKEWLLRPLLAGRWFSRLCQDLGELTDQVVAQEHQ